MPSAQFFEIGNDVCTRLRVVYLEKHLGTRNQRAGVCEPAIQCQLIPSQTRIPQRRRVGIILNASRSPPDNSTMPGTQIIVIDGMASLASLIQHLAVGGIAIQPDIHRWWRRAGDCGCYEERAREDATNYEGYSIHQINLLACFETRPSPLRIYSHWDITGVIIVSAPPSTLRIWARGAGLGSSSRTSRRYLTTRLDPSSGLWQDGVIEPIRSLHWRLDSFAAQPIAQGEPRAGGPGSTLV